MIFSRCSSKVKGRISLTKVYNFGDIKGLRRRRNRLLLGGGRKSYSMMMLVREESLYVVNG